MASVYPSHRHLLHSRYDPTILGVICNLRSWHLKLRMSDGAQQKGKNFASTSEAMELGSDSSEDEGIAPSPPMKRARADSSSNDDEASTGDAPPLEEPTSKSTVDPELLIHAKSRLSKWAARLFDPDRPRGLVQSPATIPLNDEYLKAFGERVKKENADVQVDSATIDSDGEEDLYDGLAVKSKANQATKVRIANMSYTTDAALLQAACEKYGPLLEVNVLQDKDNPALNVGRAYVTFASADDAQDCIDNLTELGGRKLRVAMATEKPSKKRQSGYGATGGPQQSLLNNLVQKDISTICYRCGEVGHYESDCKNPAKPKPCAFCGSLQHQERGCDHRIFCFNCGCPGHSVRDCTQRRGLPRRLVCGICFESGHHRNSCRNYRGSGTIASKDAICMECGRQGHFLCRELKWFYGLKGMSCFNCGSQGHSGFQCQRPKVFLCRDEPQVGLKEIEMAEAESV